MSDYYAAREDTAVLEPEPGLDVEELGQDPILPIPQLDVLILDGEYGCAVLSLAGDPLAPNLAEQVKVRTVLAIDVPSLQPQVISCLISEYGMDQDAAEALWDAAKPGMPAGREPEVQPEEPVAEDWRPEPQREEPVAQPGMQVFEDTRPEHEHERTRDEHGRYVAENPAREA